MKNLLLFLLTSLVFISCETKNQTSDSGVQKASVKVQTDANGHTTEQLNIMERLKRDNEVGSVKHLYVVSSYSGDVMEYSTVKGKVTSGNKRISPKTVNSYGGIEAMNANGNYITIDGTSYLTDEVLDDGGTYGESGNYLYWFDAQGNYHQYYPSGGTYLHISDKPLRVKKSNLSITLD